MTIRIAAVASTLFLATLPSFAEESLVTAANPTKILEIARGFGSAELASDNLGDPSIEGRMDGTRYTILFYGCKDGRECRSIQFRAYLVSEDPDLIEAVDAWNRDRRFASTFVDADGDLAIRMDVNLWGGVTAANLDDTFDWWRVSVEDLREAFGGNDLMPTSPSDPHDLQEI